MSQTRLPWGTGQVEELDRIMRDYPEMTDDQFVRDNLKHWLD